MPDRIDQRTTIAEALNNVEAFSLPKAAKRLFGVLDYKSNRTIPVSTPKQFREQLDPSGKLTERERESLGKLESLNLLFQLTDAEFTPQQSLFDDRKIGAQLGFPATNSLPDSHKIQPR